MFTSLPKNTRSLCSAAQLNRGSRLLLLTLVFLVSPLAAQNEKDMPQLELSKPVARELRGGEVHSYNIVLAANQFLHVVVEQKGIDVVVALFAPDGKKIEEVDSPNGTQGPEALQLVSVASGHHRLEVRSLEKDAVAGRYEITINELRPATPKDGKLVAGRGALKDAERLYAEKNAESTRKAMGKLKEARAIFGSVGERADEVKALDALGSISIDVGENREALEYYNQALLVSRNLRDREGEASALNGIAGVYSILGDKHRALDFFNQVLLLTKASGNRATEGTLLGNIGEVYKDLSENQKALDYLNQSVAIKRELHDRAGEAITLTSIGAVYDNSGETRKALDHYSQALTLAREVGDRRVEGYALGAVAKANVTLGDMAKSLDYFNQALALFKDIGDTSGLAGTLSDIGYVYTELGDKQKALEYYNQSLPLRRAAGYREGEVVTLTNIGQLYMEVGERQKALDNFNEALALARATSSPRMEAVLLNNIGLVYDALGEKKKALDFMNEALRILRVVGDRKSEAGLINNIGSLYSDLGNHRKALAYLNEALPLVRAAGDRNTEAALLNNIGLDHNLLGDHRKAVDYLVQGLRLSKVLGSRREQAVALFGLGKAYVKTGRVREGLENLEQSLVLFRDIKYLSGEGQVQLDLAKFYKEQGKLGVARSRIESALGIVETLRSKIGSQNLRASYSASAQDIYAFYIEVLMQLYKRNPSEGDDAAALQASERARARSLLELLTEARADIRQGVDLKLLDRERSLQRQLNTKAQSQMQTLSGPHSDEQAQTIAKEIENLTTELQMVEAQIRQTSPRYAALTQPQPLTLKEIQTQVLDEDTLLLEYSFGKDRSYLWAVTSTSITSFELPKRDKIETVARQVYALLTDTKRWDTRTAGGQRELTREKAQKRGAPNAAARLSQMLLAPVASLLANKRLLVVADGALQYIPFGALPTPVSVGPVERGSTLTRKTRRLSPEYRPLVVEHEIVSLPSASTLAVLRKELKARKPAEKTLAILADPVFESDDERVSQALKGSASAPSNSVPGAKTRELPLGMERAATESGLKGAELKIPRLPGTRNEAKQILSLVSSTQSKGSFDFDASRQTATSGELSQYRYVHFATHGFLDSLHPELSGLVLSMVDEKGNPQDGFLRAHEVFNLKLPAELVVLSACQTGLGKEVKGEGLVSLTRGFMYAGAPRVVVSLWSVSDEATAELMARFYRGMLKDNLRPAAALRAAQISLMKERRWESPFYWAAFTIQGEWR
jgi:CHAT domain-containing protein/Tfp pilus assembly protein PilF